MAVDIQLERVLGSRVSVSLINLLAGVVPPGLAHRITDAISDGVAACRLAGLVRAVRANQWVVRGASLEKAALDQAVRQNLRNIGWTLYNLYHYRRDLDTAWKMLQWDATMEYLIDFPKSGRGGLMLAGLHLSGFDLAMQTAYLHGFQPWVVTVANPRGGVLAETEIRRKMGMTIIDPNSFDALHQTARHLRRGGTVLVGIDHPITAPGLRPRFFGRPASLSTFCVRLAIRAQVPVVVLTTSQQPDGRYRVLMSDPIEMDSYADREMEVLRNAEKVLSVAESIIKEVPEQWQMVKLVWPEALDQMP